jgi:hypothetical protein
MEPPPSPLSSRAQSRDLRFYGPLLEMCFHTERRMDQGLGVAFAQTFLKLQ